MKSALWWAGALVFLALSLATAAGRPRETPALAAFAYLTDPPTFIAIGLGLLGLARHRRP